jgi:hypothetical protein
MPLAFPSHQGLIAPLWRRWPDRFKLLPCCIGAAVPDIVDGTVGVFRGHLGQGYGHSLFGLFVLCVPLGLIVNAAVKVVGRRRPAIRETMESWGVFGAGLLVEAWSVWVGALSHIGFDFISHDRFLLFYPWYEDDRFFPGWWYQRWADIPLPFYQAPFALGPPLLVWFALSALGAWMLFSRRHS